MSQPAFKQEPIDLILGALPTYRRNGPSKWMAPCPAHDDVDPSLSISRLADGRVLIHCFAGCGGAEVVSALGLSFGDLYPDGGYYKPVKEPEMTHDEWLVSIGKHSTRPLSESDKKKVLQAKLRLLKKGRK